MSNVANLARRLDDIEAEVFRLKRTQCTGCSTTLFPSINAPRHSASKPNPYESWYTPPKLPRMLPPSSAYGRAEYSPVFVTTNTRQQSQSQPRLRPSGGQLSPLNTRTSRSAERKRPEEREHLSHEALVNRLFANEPEASPIKPPRNTKVVTRKDIRSMTRGEQERFCRAVQKMMENTDGPRSSVYFRLASAHGWPANKCEHGVESCSVWRRAYLTAFESALQEADAALGNNGLISLPYWDWLQLEHNSGEMFPRVIRDMFGELPEHLIKAARGRPTELETNGYSRYSDNLIKQHLAKANLQNQVNRLLRETQQHWLAVSSRATLSDSIEAIQNTVHVALGYPMTSARYAAFDPIFFLHHCTLDRLYEQYLQTTPNSAQMFEGHQLILQSQGEKNRFEASLAPFLHPSSNEPLLPKDCFEPCGLLYVYDSLPKPTPSHVPLLFPNADNVLTPANGDAPPEPVYVVFPRIAITDMNKESYALHVFVTKSPEPEGYVPPPTGRGRASRRAESRGGKSRKTSPILGTRQLSRGTPQSTNGSLQRTLSRGDSPEVGARTLSRSGSQFELTSPMQEQRRLDQESAMSMQSTDMEIKEQPISNEPSTWLARKDYAGFGAIFGGNDAKFGNWATRPVFNVQVEITDCLRAQGLSRHEVQITVKCVDAYGKVCDLAATPVPPPLLWGPLFDQNFDAASVVHSNADPIISNKHRGQIKEIQMTLTGIGYYQGRIDGWWGPLCTAALDAFHRFHNLAPATRGSPVITPQCIDALTRVRFDLLPDTHDPADVEKRNTMVYGKTELRFSVGSVPGYFQRWRVVAEVQRAFDAWGSPINRSFVLVNEDDAADVAIRWQEMDNPIVSETLLSQQTLPVSLTSPRPITSSTLPAIDSTREEVPMPSMPAIPDATPSSTTQGKENKTKQGGAAEAKFAFSNAQLPGRQGDYEESSESSAETYQQESSFHFLRTGQLASLTDTGVCLNSAETWALQGHDCTSKQIALLPVLLHEIGHWMGLHHGTSETEVMCPLYSQTRTVLSAVDVHRLVDLYTPRSSRSRGQSSPRRNN